MVTVSNTPCIHCSSGSPNPKTTKWPSPLAKRRDEGEGRVSPSMCLALGVQVELLWQSVIRAAPMDTRKFLWRGGCVYMCVWRRGGGALLRSDSQWSLSKPIKTWRRRENEDESRHLNGSSPPSCTVVSTCFYLPYPPPVWGSLQID